MAQTFKKLRALFFAILFFTSQTLYDFEGDKLDAHIKETLKIWNAPGLAIGIIKEGRIVFLKGYGLCEIGKPETINATTTFRIASVSKTIAAGLLTTFVQEGSLQWKDKIIDHLPELKTQNNTSLNTMTLKHVLSNSTGFPRHTYTHLLDQNTPYKKIITKLGDVKPICDLGQCHTYQNVIFSLSGHIAETLSNQNYETLLETRIFQPLDMQNASCSCAAFKASPNKAMPHKKIKDGSYKALPYNCRYYDVGSAAGVNASAADMLKWLKEFLSDHPILFTKSTINYMTQPHIETPDEIKRWNTQWRIARVKRADYGLGWRLFDYSGTPFIYHGGALQGYTACLGMLPKQKIGIVVLTNSGSSFIADTIMATFIDSVLDLKAIHYNAIRKKQLNKML
ncbi:MAG TPA: hypothetical protein DD412_08305 [Holosporales bacterium]|nr:hypothetical protein [Holosporales bacterium]